MPGSVERPDLVLVLTDQQRADQYGFSSAGHWPTPTIDALAGGGVVFEQATTASTTCVPARAGLLTGLLHHRVRRVPDGLALAPGEWTLARALRSAGYQTALVGKMHLTPVHADHGFDTMRMCEDLRLAGGYGTDDVDDYHRWLVARGLDDWREGFGGRDLNRPFHGDATVHPTGWIEREAIEVLERRDPHRPLLLVVSFPNPHAPYNPAEPYASRFDPDDEIVPSDGFEVNEGLPSSFLAAMPPPERRVRDPESLRPMLSLQRGLVAHIDDAIGRILAHLDPARTDVVVTADHGDYAGHRGLLRKTPWIPFEDLSHVALVARGPSFPVGARVADPVMTIDVVPTFLAAAGLDPRTDVLDGQPLGPVLDASAPTDRTIVSTTTTGWSSARCGSLKLIMDRTTGATVVFDLATDPGERHDLRAERGDDPDVVALGAAFLHRLARGAPELDVSTTR